MECCRFRGLSVLIGVGLLASLVAGGYDETTVSGDDSAERVSNASQEATDVTAGGDGGCAEALERGDAPLRCEPGAPEPQPLEERATIVVSSPAFAEHVGPMIVAEAFGEFEKENLELEHVHLPTNDAVLQLAAGEIDVLAGSPSAAFMNAADDGFELVWTMGNFWPLHAGDLSVPQTGVWARRDAFSDPANPTLEEMRGMQFASSVGLGSSISYNIDAVLEPAGLSVNDLEFVTIPSADMVQALRNGAVDAAWIVDPYWNELAGDSDQFVQLGTQLPDETLGGYFFNAEYLSANRDIALAFTRAIMRTINTYMADENYKADGRVVEAITSAMGVDAAAVSETPAVVYDFGVADGLTTRIQEALLPTETLTYEAAIPEDELVDRLYLDVMAEE